MCCFICFLFKLIVWNGSTVFWDGKQMSKNWSLKQDWGYKGFFKFENNNIKNVAPFVFVVWWKRKKKKKGPCRCDESPFLSLNWKSVVSVCVWLTAAGERRPYRTGEPVVNPGRQISPFFFFLSSLCVSLSCTRYPLTSTRNAQSLPLSAGALR